MAMNEELITRLRLESNIFAFGDKIFNVDQSNIPKINY